MDEIFILSDGVPNEGAVQEPARIAALVARSNRWRNVRIHVLSLGAPVAARAFLQDLADSNRGTFKVVN